MSCKQLNHSSLQELLSHWTVLNYTICTQYLQSGPLQERVSTGGKGVEVWVLDVRPIFMLDNESKQLMLSYSDI